MRRWEYMLLKFRYDYHGLQAENIWRISGAQPEWVDLDVIGAKGWEMCGIVDATLDRSQAAIFKRPKMYQCRSCGKTSGAPEDRCRFCHSADVHEVSR